MCNLFHSSVGPGLSWKFKLYFVFIVTVAGTDMGNWSFHALTKVFSLNIYRICFNNTISFELLISGITSNPPNLSCSFSVICMPSQSSTETSRVIVSFSRDVIVEPAFLAGLFFLPEMFLLKRTALRAWLFVELKFGWGGVIWLLEK